MNVKGKVAIVTGAGGAGSGRAIAVGSAPWRYAERRRKDNYVLAGGGAIMVALEDRR
jgi:NAD(P)-dependent dehydrogenase (short-subunit alcohol dehydrogenase family)